MRKNKTSISKAKSYKEIGEFWDSHDLGDYWEQTRPVKFHVDIQSETTYYALDNLLSEKIQSVARRRRIPAGKLLNIWVREKLKEQKA